MISAAGHARSLFLELLDKRGCVTAMLKEQYRMHPDIAKFTNVSFYNEELKDADRVKDPKRDPWVVSSTNRGRADPKGAVTPIELLARPFLMWDTSGVDVSPGSRYRDEKVGDSRINRGDIDVTVHLLETLCEIVKKRDKGKDKWGVFVLSPYKAQVGTDMARC
jgi:superfamily I DNA and/or RNA helicase